MDNLIFSHSLFIDKEYESFINKFSSTTGADFPKGKMGNYFSSWYEGFIYCLMIGLNKNSRYYEGFKDKQQKMPNWSTRNLEQYKYCIARVLSREDILEELGLNSRENITNKFKGLNELSNDIKKICDEFSLGGLHYLMNEFEKDSSIFDDPFALSIIYEKTL